MRRIAGPTLVLVAVLGMSPTSAQPAPSAPADVFRSSKEHAQRGDGFYDRREFDQAAKEYREAYRLLPLPSLLFNIAQAYRLAGDKVSALRFYRKYVAQVASGQAVQEARDHITALERELGPIPDEPEPPPPPPPPPQIVTKTETKLIDRPRHNTAEWVSGMIVIGAGALALAAGTYELVSAHRDAGDLADRYSGGTIPFSPDDQGALDRIDRQQRNGAILLGIAGIAVVTGTVMVWHGGRRTTVVTPMPHGVAFAVTAHF